MKDRSFTRLAGAFAIVVGIAKLLSVAFYFVMPADQRLAVPAARILPSVAEGAPFLFGLFWMEALVGVLGLAVVPALSEQVRRPDEGWLRWLGTLAVAGLAVSAVGYLQTIARMPGIARAYVAGDASTQAALTAVWKSSTDLLGFWGYGAVGLWVLLVSGRMVRGEGFPKPLGYLGILTAITGLLIPLAVGLKVQTLITLIVSVGGLAGAVWFLWVGLVLRRSGAPAP